MLLYRIEEDNEWLGILEGSCITESQYKNVFYSDKCLFTPIQEFERRDMIEYNDEEYCKGKNIECALFYNQTEFEKFISKI